MNKLIQVSTASIFALATIASAAPATAQQYRETSESQAQRQQYQDQQAQYQDRRADYREANQDYQDARREYDRKLADWEIARARYDARYGQGAYARYYERPVWDESPWAQASRYDDRPGYQEARRDYDQRMAEWETARDRYDRRYGRGAYARRYAPPTWDESRWATANNAYQNNADYRAARRDYDSRMAEWERTRANYDRRYGQGAYARRYAPPIWDEGQWARNANPYYQSSADYRAARSDYDRRMADWESARNTYDRRYGQGAYARRNAPPTWDESRWSDADRYGADASAYASNIKCDNNSTIGGGVIGALAGALLGSNIAADKNRTEGAVLGGVVGAAIGAGVGHARDKYQCDQAGPYFTYDDTTAYREGQTRYSSRYDESYYTRNNCRLAPAPVDSQGQDIRYVRVCPDAQGRYRITG